MTRIKKKALAVAVTVIAVLSAAAMALSAVGYQYKVIAWNDLGMHCACPGFETFMLLPPYNTVRAQVLVTGSSDPFVADSTWMQNNGLTVNYAMVENTDANLQSDPNFQSWIINSPKLFPGFQPVVNGKVMGLAGKGLAGTMSYDANYKAFMAAGIPAYPAIDPAGPMTDPTGGPLRNPYVTANVTVKNASGTTLATTSTVVPVAFGGCCSCHITLAGQNGYAGTPWGSFQYMGKLHARTSKIDFAMIDPDGDAKAGPIRCSWCHWDPAMGESAAPGLAAVWPNYTILSGAGFTKADVKVSQYSFSDVLHRFHTQSQTVLTQFDPNIANNCYACHPGNNIACYRGAHKGKTAIWCSDCHGNLNQRVATGQMSKPWSQSTLPTCYNPSPGITSVFQCHDSSTYKTVSTYTGGLFGKWLNSRGHEGGILCQTCHGEPHALAPSTLAKDNVQLSNLQGSSSFSFPSGKDKTYPLGVCNVCHTGRSNTWQRPPHGD